MKARIRVVHHKNKIMADLYVDDKAGNVATVIKLANAADFKRG